MTMCGIWIFNSFKNASNCRYHPQIITLKIHSPVSNFRSLFYTANLEYLSGYDLFFFLLKAGYLRKPPYILNHVLFVITWSKILTSSLHVSTENCDQTLCAFTFREDNWKWPISNVALKRNFRCPCICQVWT